MRITFFDLPFPRSPFSCIEAGLEPSNQFEIQENDIVAACIQTQNGLFLSGDDSNRDSPNELFEVENVRSCEMSEIELVSLAGADRRRNIMHLYANVGKSLRTH